MTRFVDWVYQSKLVAFILLLVVTGLFVYATLRVFGYTPPNIPAGTAAAYGSLLGLPALVVGLWKWRNKGE